MTRSKLRVVEEHAGESERLANVPTYEVLAKELAKMTSLRDGRRTPRQLFFDEQWLASRWGVEIKTIQKWRYEGVGPAWHKFGENGAVRYRLRDIVAFEKISRTLPKN
ncbi:MAG: hypothetical protein V4618_06345 [Pseudomonadota bacterium]